MLTRSSSASPRRGGGGRSSSSALQSTAASGAARQNSGVSESGLPSRPVTSSAAPARRAIFSGLASDELAALNDHLNSLGVEFDFERAESDSRRALALTIYDESEQWLLDDVSAAIDCLEFAEPLLVAALACSAPSRAGMQSI